MPSHIGVNPYIGSRYFEWRKENSVFIFKPFFFSFSDVGQKRRWSNGDVPCRASVHLSSEFEGEEHPCNVVPINTSIKIHWL
jgi:hypothetical protein